jgi:quercetin dioxygenase-like cupin family protein
MDKTMAVVRKGQGAVLNILGMPTTFLCGAGQTGNAWSLMQLELPQGKGAPPHRHPWDEAYYVLAGEVKFLVDGQQHVVTAGDFLFAPGGSVHAFEGLSAEAARMLIIDAPAHAETFFREVDANVKRMPQDIDTMLEIGARHQVAFALP